MRSIDQVDDNPALPLIASSFVSRPSDLTTSDTGSLEHAVWLLRTWTPGDADGLAREAYWVVQDLALALIDARRDAASVREILSRALALLYEQNQEIDRLRTRRAAMSAEAA